MRNNFVISWKSCIFAVDFHKGNKRVRGRAEVARRAHNPEVVGSNPAPATEQDKSVGLSFFCVFRLLILFS